MPINWCPSCKIGLANEEVIDGRCERCGTETERRRISQWVIRITEYADRLISGLDETDFIEKVKAAQVNWIGRSEGAKIRFPVIGRDACSGNLHHPSGYAVGQHLYGDCARAPAGRRGEK